MILLILILYLGVKSFVASKRPTNWGHYLYHSKLDRELLHDTEVSEGLRFDVFSEKTRNYKHLQI